MLASHCCGTTRPSGPTASRATRTRACSTTQACRAVIAEGVDGATTPGLAKATTPAWGQRQRQPQATA